MSIQILSDLHLETPKSYDVFEVTPKAPYLALIGDIGTVVAHKADFLDFIKRQLQQFRAVLFVPGNHEAYHSNWTDTLQVLQEFEKTVCDDGSLGQFVLLDRETFRLPGSDIVVLGCSLFSQVPDQQRDHVSVGLNDFFQTKDWDVPDHNEAHSRDLAWLNATVGALVEKEDDIKIIIMTHWSPSTDARAVDPRHRQSSISSAFSTDLSQQLCFTSQRVKVWAFGHTHYNCEFKAKRDGGEPLRLVTNQRGYYFSSSAGFDPEKVIEL